jgi:putative transposase
MKQQHATIEHEVKRIGSFQREMTDRADPACVTLTLRLKVQPESCGWLNAAAVEVNQVWNFCNERAATVLGNLGRWLSGFALCYETAGSTQYMKRIGADTIQCVCTEYAAKRNAARKQRLRWRVSWGAKRSLGWVPFKAASVKRKGKQLRFAGKTFRVFESERLVGVKWKQGCFAQDAVGDWWLCLPVERAITSRVATREAVGIDFGLASIATTSDGETLQAARFYRDAEQKVAHAQRRGHKRQAKRLHRRAANRRRDALHKFSRRIVDQYQNIIVGDVSAPKLTRTRLAKSVLDSGWGTLRQMLLYKGEYACRSVQVVSERNTSRVCSQCGLLSGPQGLRQLAVRAWTCSGCGEPHDRDVNAARNILARAKVLASVSGNESSNSPVPPSRPHGRREAGTETARTAA